MIKWLFTYVLGSWPHFIRFMAVAGLIGLSVFMTFNFTCGVTTKYINVGAKPVDAKININK